MNGLMLQDRDGKALATQPLRASVYVDVDLHVTRYHIEQAKTQRRRAKSRADAPKRARARMTAVDAALDAAHQIIDADERKQALLTLEDKATSSKRIAEQARSERELVRRRMSFGFESTAGVEVGGRMREPFREKGLRSESLGAAGKLFVRGCRKGRFLRSANEKGLIMNQHRSKLLSLDYAWVEGNREMVSLVRIDLDTFFESFEYLRAQLQRLVDDGRLPCLPHLVAGDMAPFRLSERGADGVFRDRVASMLVKPHLWFILPDAVNMKSTGRAGPKRLLDAVYRGLVNVLTGLGADPNAKALLVRGKSPLSPWWESMNFNDDVFPSLSGYAAVLGDAMKISLEDLARKTAEKQSGLPTAVSNQFFTAASKEAWRILRELHERRDREYLAALADRDLLAGMLARRMPMDRVLLLGEGLVEPARGAYVLDKVIGYAASRWSPDRADEAISFRSRGRMKHLVADAASLKEKQAISGKAVAEARMQAARHAVLKAMDSVERSGAPFTQAEVVRASGLSRNTVGRHWRFCLGRRPGRCLDKKGGVTPATLNMAHAVQDAARNAVDEGLEGGQDMKADGIRKPPVKRTIIASVTKPQETAVASGTESITCDGIGTSMVTRKPMVSSPFAGMAANSATGDESVSGDPRATDTESVALVARETSSRVPSTMTQRPLPPLFLFQGEARRREEERREIARRLAAPVAHSRSPDRL